MKSHNTLLVAGISILFAANATDVASANLPSYNSSCWYKTRIMHEKRALPPTRLIQMLGRPIRKSIL